LWTGENVQNVVRICCFSPLSKYPNISACFQRFLRVGWSDWADFFCIESDFLRHKFRLPTGGILETEKFWLFWCNTPLGGTCIKTFRQKKYFPNGPYTIGNHIRWVRKKFKTQSREWDTLRVPHWATGIFSAVL
jgi:hypothetical protein